MAVTSTPVFAQGATLVLGKTLVNANTAKDGTGTVVTVATGSANGTKVLGVVYRPAGTNSTASAARIFLNNGSTNATPANNSLIDEVTLPVSTVSETAALSPVVWVPLLPLILPNGHNLNLTIGTAGTAGWAVTAITQDL